MTDAEILDKIFKLLRQHDGHVVAGGGSVSEEALEDRVFVRQVRALSGQRQRGWKRTFKVKTPAAR